MESLTSVLASHAIQTPVKFLPIPYRGRSPEAAGHRRKTRSAPTWWCHVGPPDPPLATSDAWVRVDPRQPRLPS